MLRYSLAAVITAAALGAGAAPAQAVCPLSPETPPAGLGVCYSLVADCVNVAVYYRVPVIGSGGGPVGPICP